MTKYSLKEITKDLHHIAEKHSVGESMADGTISESIWVDWLNALYYIHSTIDENLSNELKRTNELAKDISLCCVTPNSNFTALEYAMSLKGNTALLGACYVFTGAHLMGGAITAKNIRHRLPVNHLDWDNRKEAVKLWNPLRDMEELAHEAKRAFENIIKIMDEIVEKR